MCRLAYLVNKRPHRLVCVLVWPSAVMQFRVLKRAPPFASVLEECSFGESFQLLTEPIQTETGFIASRHRPTTLGYAALGVSVLCVQVDTRMWLQHSLKPAI